ncbi:hypothetical protein PPYR_11657 [Photinus pyralis]|uniref:non-specific serine/threonine protein kinase n=1 Tax=Photinus pyralis TaxID=7054 RepID=A0A5N4AC41_PHOPY|nr:hypothetical protein PPYR_11657 [Photinus pyralis]
MSRDLPDEDVILDISNCQDFAGSWMCLQTLGEGAYGEVKLLMHRHSKETLAAKIIDLKKHKDAAQNVRREVRIHSILDHENIIKMYGSRCVGDARYEIIYLEFAAGGELFNRIDPQLQSANGDYPCMALSQPMPCNTSRVNPANIAELLKVNEHHYFSQPTQNDDLLISSQIQLTQTHKKNDFPHLIKRMTRFFVKTNCEETVQRIGVLLDALLYKWTMDEGGVTISTTDRRKAQLVFKANVIDMNGKILLDFRLSRGCGLEFKRRFLQIKRDLVEIILKPAADVKGK